MPKWVIGFGHPVESAPAAGAADAIHRVVGWAVSVIECNTQPVRHRDGTALRPTHLCGAHNGHENEGRPLLGLARGAAWPACCAARLRPLHVNWRALALGGIDLHWQANAAAVYDARAAG